MGWTETGLMFGCLLSKICQSKKIRQLIPANTKIRRTFIIISTLFLQGAALGLAAAVSPGSFQAYLINRSLTGGWRGGAPVAFSPLLSDPLIILAVLLLLGELPAGYLRWIGLAGGMFAFYLAWGLWRQWRAGSGLLEAASFKPGQGLLRGAVMNLLSPGPYLFWTLICGPILLGALRQSVLDGAAFLGGFYSVFIGAMLGMVFLFSQARRLGARTVNALALVSIIILALFGGMLLWRAFV